MTSIFHRWCLAAALPLALALSACQTSSTDIGPVNTLGRQAVVTTAAPGAKVREVLVYQAIGKNREVMADTPSLVVIDMPSNDFLYTVVAERGLDLTARVRVTYTFAETNGRTTVAAAASLVSGIGGNTQELETFDGDPKVAAALQQQITGAAAEASRG